MKTKLLSIDIFLGDRFLRTMFLRNYNVVPLFINGSLMDHIDLNDVADEVRRRLPSLRNRNDMHIYLNN